jgi:hypothetical protein
LNRNPTPSYWPNPLLYFVTESQSGMAPKDILADTLATSPATVLNSSARCGMSAGGSRSTCRGGMSCVCASAPSRTRKPTSSSNGSSNGAEQRVGRGDTMGFFAHAGT